ncbi:uncharacterized protein LOC111697901 [Eurytemora carolleeae]|uniref:uncharacterized protein LOC111697901 n=1 Tax=Eurytemora carolleeae TaxID=1294199 RepID=UPI000C78E62C|nr:uncharacterized protein LOC111697901 [Eurytemora carolleeae]XP_023323809.1 uncharacterized protein LOC111697901 [Eurytemora carolleeae]XP_023323810.1 uncharacterized protein LOC111697901 [Eurytemora carolleeae]XP_023323811.1 uncharacterized protein LOC111697901 [Eurytemora carolleeae]|eukprot:XP_023323808.1 uncharacterized protein LOC111697901 [Eurytemora affinis]
MFVLIPTTLQTRQLPPGIQGIKPKGSQPNLEIMDRESQDPDSDPDSRSLISRHPAGDSIPVMYEQGETGFLWSWNFMISKKWKNMSVTGATGDIGFMDKVLLDFRKFCSNDDGRLEQFWEQCLDSQHLQDLQPT